MKIANTLKRFDFAHAQWDKFKEGTVAAIGEIKSECSIDEYNDTLCEMILRMASVTIPTRGTPKPSVIVL